MFGNRTGTDQIRSVDWGKFNELPKYDPAFGLDTARINARLSQRKGDPRRIHTGTCVVPLAATPSQVAQITYQACNRWISSLAKEGWTLITKIVLAGPGPYFDIRDQILVDDMTEYTMRAGFQMDSSRYKPVRTEIPMSSVKQAPDHKVTLKEALRA